jgi:hypothetical protein
LLRTARNGDVKPEQSGRRASSEHSEQARPAKASELGSPDELTYDGYADRDRIHYVLASIDATITYRSTVKKIAPSCRKYRWPLGAQTERQKYRPASRLSPICGTG